MIRIVVNNPGPKRMEPCPESLSGQMALITYPRSAVFRIHAQDLFGCPPRARFAR